MATIKEMAEESCSIHDDPWMYIAYIDGANAVLNEIISCWDWENKDNRLIVPAELVLHKIEDKIKELKGE